MSITTITATSDSVPEGQEAVFTVHADPAPGSDLTVNLQQAVKDNCATLACDAVTTTTTTTPTVTITGGQTSAEHIVQTQNDELDEFDGSVKVTVQPTDDGQYDVGTASAVTVGVVDEEVPPALEFSAEGYTGTEGMTSEFVISIPHVRTRR